MKIVGETVISGHISSVWAAITDVDNWPTWDPHEEAAHLDGPFVVGTKGWSKPRGAPAAHWTITKVVPHQLWSSESPMPGGKISGENRFEVLDESRVRCRKVVEVSGPLIPLFWLYFGRLIRRDMFATWQALEHEVARRTTALGNDAPLK